MTEAESLIKEFLVESYENLDQLDRDLVTLEKDPQNRERLGSIFRTIHTIKGTCGFFGFDKLQSVAHVGENLLSRLRDGLLLLNPEITSALLAMVDAVRLMLGRIESSGQEGDGDYSTLIAALTRLQEAAPAEQPVVQVVEKQVAYAGSNASVSSEPSVHVMEKQVVANAGSNAVTISAPATAIGIETVMDPRRVEAPVEPKAPEAHDSNSAAKSPETGNASVSESNIRVDVGLLDKLMNLVGELVLARNQVLQFSASQKDTAFLSTTQRLNLITSELQEGVMKTRMQPIGNIWNRFPRVVRDLALACGKQVRVEMQGKETELDKTIIEAIKDPLTHVVRNSVDHGIETPEARIAKGKPVEGCLLLRAFHEGGQVNIEITDDGAGIDVERVKKKAVERGLISFDQAERMSEREAVQLIFLPGFSTAEKVTNVSGRGVGMDVVKTNIEKIGGTVDIQSLPGRGATLKIKIPLTLAIIPALIITNGNNRYAIPQVSLLELVRLEGEQIRKGIAMIHGAPVYRLRGRLLPLVYLDRELKVLSVPAGTEQDVLNIVILQADERQFGLVVQRINDTEEIVVKPLSKQLKGIPVFAGSTIMGDGRVALILDVLGIAQRSGVVSEVRDRTLGDLATKSQERHEDTKTLLLVGTGANRRLAIPLEQVARLEVLPLSAVEKADDQRVVQYRGQIMPLIYVSDVLGGGSELAATTDTMQVVVYTAEGRSVGLVVDRILDIVEATVKIQQAGRRAGILGSAVIQQRVTDLLDVHATIQAASPDFFAAPVAV
jgi:two-component system chemotaxis sensor kinase CheA